MRPVARLVLVLTILSPSLAAAQQLASIAGVVRDVSGAVLPGVTVEAASPALIEKVRTVVTDGTGQYQIVDLRPGTYSVTFTLTGFNAVKREGLELSGSFTATVSVELRVGAVEETITVTGESPLVDVQNVRQQRVMGQEVIDAVPSGRSAAGLAVMIPGITVSGGGGGQDVGGSLGDIMSKLIIHGSKVNEFRLNLDGVPATNSSSNGADTSFEPNLTAVQEITVDTSGASAENASGAVRVNLVPRDGGNTFSGQLFVTGANSSFQSSNFTQELKDLGLTVPNRLQYLYDVNPGMGGPIVRDKVWFYASYRRNAAHNYVGGMYEDLNAGKPNLWTYAPDLTRQATYNQDFRVVNGRITWQVNNRNKVAVTWDDQERCQCPSTSATNTPQASRYFMVPLNRTASLTWTSPMTNRLLLEAALGHRVERWRQNRPRHLDPTWDMIGVQDQGTGINYRAKVNNIGFADVLYPLVSPRASLSYVTGAHAFKAGYNQLIDWEDRYIGGPGSQQLTYRFNNGVPNQVTQFAYPLDYQWHGNAIGLFAQDKWTVNRFTVNAGVRFDYFHNYYPEVTAGPALLTPNRNVTFPKTEWQTFKDLTPRLGVAYDLFGNGRTAVKGTINKYVATFTGQGAYGNANPVTQLASQVTRSWTDRDTDFVVDCDLQNPLAQTVTGGDICGVISDLNFGNVTRTTATDPEILKRRPYNWEFSTSVQHQITDRDAVDVGYFRRWYGNFTVTDNLAVAPGDYSPFSITAPVDSRLPDGGGYAITGLYDLNPDKVGAVNNLQTFAAKYGKQIEHWNGVDFNVNARLEQGVLLQGGLSSGRTSTDNCDLVAKIDNPSTRFCHVDTAFLTQVKLLGAYTVPRIDVQVGATFQSLAGPQLSASYIAANAIVQPSLGRPLSGGANTTVNLIEPGTMYGQRLNQLDLRFARVFRVNRMRATVNADVYNAANGSAVIVENANYAQWRRPQTILAARLFRLSLQVDF